MLNCIEFVPGTLPRVSRFRTRGVMGKVVFPIEFRLRRQT